MSELFALLGCMVVLLICVTASIAVTLKLRSSLKTHDYSSLATFRATASTLAGSVEAAPDTGMHVFELRNIVMRTVSPRPEELIAWAYCRFPNATDEQRAAKIIAAEAHKCGFIGFLTGVPGFIALPITLPIDLYTTGKLQACMVESLLFLYRADLESDEIERLRWMILLGGGSLAKSATQLVLKILGKSAIRAIPVLGGVAGYLANYFLAQAAGRAVQAHMNGKLVQMRSAAASSLQRAVQPLQSLPQPMLAVTSPTIALNVPVPASIVPEYSTPDAALDAQQALIACPNCQHENDVTYRFCGNCGSLLQQGNPT